MTTSPRTSQVAGSFLPVRSRSGIERIVPRQRVHQDGAVLGGPGHGAGSVQAGGEGNDAAAIHLAYQSQGSDQVSITGNTMQYNNGYALESYRTTRLHQADNRHVLNTLRPAQELISADPVLLLEEGLK